MMSLKDKTALVTGGGSGIGLGIARALSREGCRVAICGREGAKLERAARSEEGRRDTPEGAQGAPPLLARVCDVSVRSQVAELFAWTDRELGALDIVVLSAGVNIQRRRMADLDPADWDRLIAINATGAYNCMREALQRMRPRRSGLIINISSIAGKRALSIAGPAYCASKFAATALGTAVGLEERPNGIRITNIYPGEANTPILDQRPVPVPPEKKAVMVQPEDIGACVVLLAKLPERVLVPELVITPLYQEYA
jgi:NAD(P)-dependent dehydrogenase (short-subunit alcohol dehydrogenase family)